MMYVEELIDLLQDMNPAAEVKVAVDFREDDVRSVEEIAGEVIISG